MNSQEYRNLQEAYLDVYQELDELHRGRHGQTETEYMDSRSDAGKQISGDSKTSGAAYSHRSYKGVGKPAKPGERQETQGKMDRGTKIDIEYRKAARLKKEELSLDERVLGQDPEMRRAGAKERKSGDKRLSPAAGKENANKMQRDVKFFDKLTKKNRNVVGLVTKEEVEQIDEAEVMKHQKERGAIERRKKMKGYEPPTKGVHGEIERRQAQKPPSKLRSGSLPESYDLFDAILEYLVAEGYADTNESALVIMANMSEEWRQSIVEVKLDPRGRPASGPMNVYKQSKPNTDPAFQAALKSVRDADAKKTPEQRKAELDAYRERQMNNK